MAREDLQRIQELGFRTEVTEGTSPINVANPPIHFGINTTSLGMLPRTLQEVVSYYKGGSLDPYTMEVAKKAILGQIAYIPTNSLMWYYAFGSVSDAGSNVHKLVGINSGDLPSASYRYETSNGGQGHRKDAVGNKLKRLAMSIDLQHPNNVLTENFTFIGRNLKNEGELTDNQRISPVFADGNALEAQKGYRMDVNGSIIWDVDGSAVDIKNYCYDFNYIMDTTNASRFVQGQNYAKWVSTGVRTHVVAFKMIRSDVIDVFDDYLAQVPNNTFKNMSFTIYNSHNHVKHFDFTNVAILKCDLNYAMINEGEEPFYDVEAQVQSVEMLALDGVPTSFYGY